MMKDDPVVDSIRRARREITRSCGRDAHRLFEWAKQIEAAHQERVVGYERPKQEKK